MPVDQIQYSERYQDDVYEYRHVLLPPDIARFVPKSHLMTETEWRNLGVQQSPGWLHYMIHNPEPHVLLFRRPRTDVQQPIANGHDSNTGSMVKTVDSMKKEPVVEMELYSFGCRGSRLFEFLPNVSLARVVSFFRGPFIFAVNDGLYTRMHTTPFQQLLAKAFINLSMDSIV